MAGGRTSRRTSRVVGDLGGWRSSYDQAFLLRGRRERTWGGAHCGEEGSREGTKSTRGAQLAAETQGDEQEQYLMAKMRGHHEVWSFVENHVVDKTHLCICLFRLSSCLNADPTNPPQTERNISHEWGNSDVSRMLTHSFLSTTRRISKVVSAKGNRHCQ